MFYKIFFASILFSLLVNVNNAYKCPRIVCKKDSQSKSQCCNYDDKSCTIRCPNGYKCEVIGCDGFNPNIPCPFGQSDWYCPAKYACAYNNYCIDV